MCIEAIQRLSRLWKIASPEDRQGLARSLFERIVFDLDQRQIVEFKLKAWADRFLVLLHTMHGLEVVEAEKQKIPPAQEVGNAVPHREIASIWRSSTNSAYSTIIHLLYRDVLPSNAPKSQRIPSKTLRNQELQERYDAGSRITDLAAEYGLSPQRVSQIVRGKHK